MNFKVINNQGKRNFGLDVLRVVAVAFVLLHHWVGTMYYLLPTTAKYFTILGYYGVEIFFVLSGFLIGNILIKSFNNTNSYGFKNIVTFWMRRWLRTLPLYYFMFIAYTIVSIYVSSPSKIPFWKFALFVQYFPFYTTDFFGISWSLAIEEWFYLSFPIVIFCFSKFFKNSEKKKILIYAIVTYLIVFIVARGVYYFNMNKSWNDNYRKALFFRLDSIAFGVLGAYIFYYYKDIWDKYKNMILLFGIILFVFSTYYFFKRGNVFYLNPNEIISFFDAVLYLSCVNLSVLLFLPFVYTLNTKNSLLINSITHTSKISYSLYLVHPLVLLFINSVFSFRNGYSYPVYHFFCYNILSLIVSTLTYKIIETTFLKIRERKVADD